MRALVVDCSVAIKWAVAEPDWEHARALLTYAGPIVAPDLIIVEIANVVWKKALQGEIVREQAQRAPSEIAAGFAKLPPSTQFVERAIEIAFTLKHPVYDCVYLACGETEEALFVTDDRRLIAAIKGTTYEDRVINLAQAQRTLSAP